MKSCISIGVFLTIFFFSAAQNDELCRKSTEGTDFWFGFMESRNYHDKHYLEITVTAREATTFKILLGKGQVPYGGTYAVQNNNRVRVRIPYEDWSLVEASGSEEVQDRGIHLISEKPVNVYALNWDRNSADVAVIYPTESLGNEYFAMCYEPHIHERQDGEYGNGRNSQFLVVASEDSTNVLIIPTKETDKKVAAGDSIYVRLNRGEVYQVQSYNRENLFNQGDLTGSFISSDKPIAFYSGSLATTIPHYQGTSAWDHLYEQIPPIQSWGREYYVVPLKSREQDRIRIMAAHDNTRVQITGEQDVILNRGQFYEYILLYNAPDRIFADKPILVAQFSQSQSVDRNFTDGNGDPFMIILSSISQSKNDVTFVAYDSDQIKKYFVNIVTLTSQIHNLRYNNNQISSFFTPFPSNNEYSYAQLGIDAGSHRIYNTNKDRGFLAYVYGFGGVESYGYGVGFNLDLVLDLGQSINFDGDTIPLCYGEQLTLDAGPYFDTYNWDSGDTTQTLTVSEEGKYYVKTTTIDGCVLDDSIFVLISHPKTGIGIDEKDISHCAPFSIDLAGDSGYQKYLWQNQDGDTLSNNQFYTANKTGQYRVTVFDEYNCNASDTMNLVVFPVPKVKIQGESLICGEKSTNLSVSITNAPQSIWNYDGSFTWSSNNQNLVFSEDQHTSTNIQVSEWGDYEIFYRLQTVDGCVINDTFKITFHPQPVSDFVFEDDAKCEGYSKKLLFTGSATDSAAFYWDLDGCLFTDTLGWQTYNVSVGAFLEKQPYIKLLIDDNGCLSETTTKPLGAKPNFTMEADPLRGCDELTVNFTSRLLTEDDVVFEWKFHDGEKVNEQNATKFYPSPGFFEVSLTITNPVTQCVNGFTLDSMVKVFPTPVADITANPDFCYPDSARIFYTHNIDSSFCEWDFNGARQIGNGNDSVIIVLDDPTAKIGLTVDEYGCVSERTEIQLKRKPHFDFFTENEDGCQPYSMEVFAQPIDSFLYFSWITDSLPYPTAVSHSFFYPDTGRFDVGLIGTSTETNCTDTLIKPGWIWVHPKPFAKFEVDFPVALLEHAEISYTNYSRNATQYLWDFGDENFSNEMNPIHTFTELGEFNSVLIAESDFGCTDTAEFVIKILPFSVFTPNAFRPDSEIPENRIFMPVGTGADISRFNLKIYDRWGQLIFETDTPENPWDGKNRKGEPAPMGNYVWIANFFDIQGFEHNQKGQVLLIR